MKASDIFKVRKGSKFKNLSGAKGELVEVAEVNELLLRADCKKFGIGFRDTEGRLWYVREISRAELLCPEQKEKT